MSQSLLDTIPPLLTKEGLSCVRSGAGRSSQFYAVEFRDRLTIRITDSTAALCWSITFADPDEKPLPIILHDIETGAELKVSSLKEFEKVKDEWVERVKQGC